MLSVVSSELSGDAAEKLHFIFELNNLKKQ
jgi:hypothetical protein